MLEYLQAYRKQKGGMPAETLMQHEQVAMVLLGTSAACFADVKSWRASPDRVVLWGAPHQHVVLPQAGAELQQPAARISRLVPQRRAAGGWRAQLINQRQCLPAHAVGELRVVQYVGSQHWCCGYADIRPGTPVYRQANCRSRWAIGS